MASQRKQFPFSDFEAKWQSRWLAEGAFRAPNPGDRDFDPDAAEILRARHVSLSKRRRPARGTCRRLHRYRYHSPLQTDARIQRPAPDGMGCLRAARGAIRNQDRPAPARNDGEQYRALSERSSNPSASATTGRASSAPQTRRIFAGRSGFFSSFTIPGSTPRAERPNPSRPTRARTRTMSVSHMLPKCRSIGVPPSAPCSPTKRSLRAGAKLAGIRSSGVRCGNGCFVLPPTQSGSWTSSKGSIGRKGSNCCNAIGSAAVKAPW